MLAHRISLERRNRLFGLAFPFGKIVEINGERFRLHAEHRRFTDHEPLTWQSFCQAIGPGDIVVDVGANMGVYTLAAARRVGEQGRVFAMDPDPRSVRRLGLHLRMNRLRHRTQVIEACAGEANGAIPFAFHNRTYWSSGVVLDARAGTTYAAVPVFALDALFQRIDVLKIDVEGMEGRVLAGAKRLLADPVNRPRAVLVEVHEEPLADLGEDWATIRAAIPGYRWEEIGATNPPEWLGTPER